MGVQLAVARPAHVPLRHAPRLSGVSGSTCAAAHPGEERHLRGAIYSRPTAALLRERGTRKRHAPHAKKGQCGRRCRPCPGWRSRRSGCRFGRRARADWRSTGRRACRRRPSATRTASRWTRAPSWPMRARWWAAPTTSRSSSPSSPKRRNCWSSGARSSRRTRSQWTTRAGARCRPRSRRSAPRSRGSRRCRGASGSASWARPSRRCATRCDVQRETTSHGRRARGPAAAGQ